MDLIKRAQAGCEDAFEELFKNYRPVIYTIQRKYFVRDFDEDDWLQEGWISFHKTLQRFDPSMGVTFGAYFKHNFENHIRSELRKQNAYKRRGLIDAVSVEHKIECDGPDFLGGYEQITPAVDEQLIVEEFLDEFPEMLSTLEMTVLCDYLQGIDFDQIAEQEREPQRKIKCAYIRARKKMIRQLTMS